MTKLLATAALAMLLSATASVAALCGDVNEDGAVDIGDALVIGQYANGMRACGSGAFSRPGVCDVTNDGACDMHDAEMIALCDVDPESCAMDCQPFRCLRGQRKLGQKAGR